MFYKDMIETKDSNGIMVVGVLFICVCSINFMYIIL